MVFSTLSVYYLNYLYNIEHGEISQVLRFSLCSVCTQLLVSRPDEENISCYLQLIEKCLTHEVRRVYTVTSVHNTHHFESEQDKKCCVVCQAFTETQKKRLLSWKQQVLKLLRLFPRKTMMDSGVYRRGCVSLPFSRISLPRCVRPHEWIPVCFVQVAGVRIQLSAHSWICERRFGQTGTEALPDAPARSSAPRPHGADDCRRSDRSVAPTLARQPRGRQRTGSTGQSHAPHRLKEKPLCIKHDRWRLWCAGVFQNLWFGNPGGSNSMPSQSRSSVQRTHSLPVHTSPQTMLLFQQQGTHSTPDLQTLVSRLLRALPSKSWITDNNCLNY